MSIKDAVRERDGYRCVGCGMTAQEHKRRYGQTLHVHRKTPGRLGGQYVPDNAESRCRSCHSKADGALLRRKRQRTRSARFPVAVVEAAEILAPIFRQSIPDFLGELLEPAVEKKWKEAEAKFKSLRDRRNKQEGGEN